MRLKRRVERLEEGHPEDPGPLVVVSCRRIVKPTPDGPVTVGRVTRTYRGGELVNEERER